MQDFVTIHVGNLSLVRSALAAVDAEHDCTRWNLGSDDHAFLRLLVARHRLGENLTETVFFGPAQDGSRKIGVREGGSVEIGSVEIGVREIGSREVGSPEIGAREGGSVEIGSVEIDVREIGSREIGSVEIGLREIGSREVGSPEIGAREVGVREVGSPEIGSDQVGRTQVGPHFFPTFAVLSEPVLVLFNDFVKFFLCHIIASTLLLRYVHTHSA